MAGMLARYLRDGAGTEAAVPVILDRPAGAGGLQTWSETRAMRGRSAWPRGRTVGPASHGGGHAPRQAHTGVAGTGSSPCNVGAVVGTLAGSPGQFDAASEAVLRVVDGQNAVVRAKSPTAA